MDREHQKVKSSDHQLHRRINRRDSRATVSASSLKQQRVAENRDVVVPLDLSSATRTMRPREHNGLAQWQPMDDDIEKAPEQQAKNKNNGAYKVRRKIFHRHL